MTQKPKWRPSHEVFTNCHDGISQINWTQSCVFPQSGVPAVCLYNYHCSSMAFNLFAYAFEISAAKWFLWHKIRQRLANNIISGSRMKSVGLLVTRDRKSQPVYGNRGHKRKFCPRWGRPPTAVKVGGLRDTVTSFCTAPASGTTVRHGRTCCHHRSWRRKQKLATKSSFLQSCCDQKTTQWIRCPEISCKFQPSWIVTSKSQLLLYVPPGLTFINATLCCVFWWISEQTAIISLYNINWLVFKTEMECVHCAVRTGYFKICQV